MNQQTLETLRAHARTLEAVQAEIEAILAAEQASMGKLQKRTEAYDLAEQFCESLAYAVDDLDSVLGNLEEITTES